MPASEAVIKCCILPAELLRTCARLQTSSHCCRPSCLCAGVKAVPGALRSAREPGSISQDVGSNLGRSVFPRFCSGCWPGGGGENLQLDSRHQCLICRILYISARNFHPLDGLHSRIFDEALHRNAPSEALHTSALPHCDPVA